MRSTERHFESSFTAPLNVSREILQESRDVEAIRNGCVKPTLGLLEDLAEKQEDKYATFWVTFNKVLKEGFVDDSTNRQQLANVVRFAITASGTKHRTSRSLITWGG
jgi:molecular chaperone HtpG